MKNNYRKIKIFVLILAFILISLSFASAVNVCCEKIKNDGGFCQNTDEGSCDNSQKEILPNTNKGYWASAATSCALTSFCKPGCCFMDTTKTPTNDGLCYANYPKATCEAKGGTYDASDPSCVVSAQCQEGCCIIGSEASLMTQARCALRTKDFPQLQMEFRSDVNDELACINIGRQSEKGCCVSSPNDCKYGARSLCTAGQTTTTGFFSGKYCSELKGATGSGPVCNCVPSDPKLGGTGKKKDNTGCLADSDDVHWIDSCGNPEGAAEVCEYINGNLCGDSDKDGEFTCESLNCEDKTTGIVLKGLSLNLEDYTGSNKEVVKENKVLNGESWCLYDSSKQAVDWLPGLNPPGSRYYRAICMNGKEFVEPCEDYRKEWCVDGEVNVGNKKDGGQAVFHEARCRENRAQSCIDSCNTLQIAESEEQVLAAAESDFNCCLNTDLRDCTWVGPVVDGNFNNQAIGAGKHPLYCIPKVDPGFKFWESEGTTNCASANLNCEMKLRCPGVSALIGKVTGKKCGWRPGFSQKSQEKWEILYGKECVETQFINAANTLCRNMGDCGADINLQGKVSWSGFTNTPKVSNDFRSIIDADKPGYLKTLGVSILNTGTWTYRTDGEYNYKEKGKMERFFTNSKFTKWAFGFNTAFALMGGVAATKDLGTGKLGTIQKFFGTVTGTQPGQGFSKGFISKLDPLKFKALLSFLPGAGGLLNVPGAGDEEAGGAENKQIPFKQRKQQAKIDMDTAYQNKYNAEDELYKLKNDPDYAADDTNYIRKLGAAEQKVNEANEVYTDTQQKYDEISKGADKQLSGKMTLGIANHIMWAYQVYQFVNVMMATEETITITTTCSPWVAPIPTKGACEACNAEEYQNLDANKNIIGYDSMKGKLKCSQYKCKSYGAACDIVNEGTAEEMCVSKEPSDVKAPLISFWKEGTDKLLQTGVRSDTAKVGVDLTNYKIPAYERVLIGIQTDEPAQCKMSFKHGIEFEKMDPIYFGTSTYKYYHSSLLTYPKDINITDSTLKLGEAGQGYKLYVRCQDAMGNDNENDYVIKFDIEKGPDLTPPVIETTTLGTLGTSSSSPTERYLSLGANTTDITLILNEPATCKWSNSDVDYATMPKENECTALNSNMNDGLYSCEFNKAKKESGSLTVGEALKGFNDSELKYYYFKCKDQPTCINGKDLDDVTCTNNIDTKSYVLALRKSYPLNISEILPTGNIYIGGVGGNVTLEIRTEGGAEKTGKAYCGFVTGENNKNNIWGMSAFFNTNSSYHSQVLSQLSTGAHKYYVGCVDIAGNTVYGETTFNLALDTEGPGIIRAFIDSTSGTDLFKIKTDEKSTCEYSTTGAFKYGEGNEMLSDDGAIHAAQGGVNIYYVLCTDQFNNIGILTTVNFLTK